MITVPKPDYIHFLITQKFPELVEPMSPMAKKFRSNWMVYNDAEDEWVQPSQEILNQAEQYKQELENLSKSEIKKRYDIEYEKKNHEDDKKRFFNEEKANADFDYWSKMPEWTIEEAVILSFGKNPSIVTWKRLEGQMSYLSPFVESCYQLMELAKRAKKSNLFTDNSMPLLSDPIRPYLYVQWMQKNELVFSESLAEKVLKYYQKNKPPKTDFELSMEQIHKSIQQPSITNVNTSLPATKIKPNKKVDSNTVKELSTREKDSLLKIIITMAIDGYGFDPKSNKSPLPKELEGAIQRLGMSLSDDTIRKWLKEASNILSQDYQKDFL